MIIGEYSPKRSRSEYLAIITKPEANNCFSIILLIISIYNSFLGMPPSMQPPPFIRPDVQAAPPVLQPDEPAAKKSKVDAGPEANLIPENIFVQKHQGSVRFQVQIPDIPDKTEWKCHGQKIFLALPWTDPVRILFIYLPV